MLKEATTSDVLEDDRDPIVLNCWVEKFDNSYVWEGYRIASRAYASVKYNGQSFIGHYTITHWFDDDNYVVEYWPNGKEGEDQEYWKFAECKTLKGAKAAAEAHYEMLRI